MQSCVCRREHLGWLIPLQYVYLDKFGARWALIDSSRFLVGYVFLFCPILSDPILNLSIREPVPALVPVPVTMLLRTYLYRYEVAGRMP